MPAKLTKTAMPTPQQIAAIAAYAERLEGLAKGERGPVIAEACAELDITPATFYRWLAPHTATARKRRADAGNLALTEAEADKILTYCTEATRANKKGIAAIKQAVQVLRENGEIKARRVDQDTGEIKLLSVSAICNALRVYGKHPEQMKRPAPHIRMSTEHPNHLWQVDASVCVVFYLPDGGASIVGVDQAVHYKNKPENLKAIERFRVIRYVVTDHASGVVRWRYYPHSESGRHTVQFLAWCMARQRPETDPFHGAPLDLMSDPGATSARLVRRFCKRLKIHLQVNKPHAPRAKGQVEQGQNLVETKFESGLKFQRHRVTSIDALNALADVYQVHFNATARHTRHGETRFAAWSRITAEQLRVTPSEDVLLSLATEEPESRDIGGDLTVSFKGQQWDVRHVPGAEAGQKLMVHWHPFIADTAMAVLEQADGTELHIELHQITKDAFGFPSTAVPYGTYRGIADDRIEQNRKQVALVATGEKGIDAAEKARAAKDYVPFGGRVNPYKEAEEATLPAWLPKRGTQLMGADTIRIELTPLDHVAMAEALREIFQLRGVRWTADHWKRMTTLRPNGEQEAALEALADELLGVAEETFITPRLALVG